MSKLLIATHNLAKLKEIKQFLTSLLPNVTFLSLTDLKITQEQKETGKTFKDNARLKAENYAHISHLPTLADDGGLIIDSLNGEPGVHSNRWMGHRGTDEELITYCMTKMKGIPKNKRTARFETCIYFYDPKSNDQFDETGIVEGVISKNPSTKREPGYPYRSVFIVSQFKKFYLDLNEDEHEQINHRFHALKRLAQKLKTWYN